MSKNVFGREDYVEFCKNENKKVLVPGKSLVQYVRTKKGQPKGTMVAYRGDDNKIYVGYSLCNSKVDKFDRQIGMRKAVERALTQDKYDDVTLKNFVDKIPQSVVKPLDAFLERAERFFKSED